MKTLILTIALTAALLAQPNQLDLRQDPPTAVQSERVSSAYTGTSGATTYYYWVVTRYPIGFIVPTAPVVVGGAAALGGGNSVALAWPAMTGASSYDVLRTTTNAAPSSCTCAVVLATTGTTLTDNGGALSAWPPGGLNSAGVAQAELQINNRDAGAPYITMAVRNAQRTLNYQLGILKNGAAPSYVPSGFIQPYSQNGVFACVDSSGADCLGAPVNVNGYSSIAAAYAAGPATGVSIYVPTSRTETTALTLTAGKPINLSCAAGVTITWNTAGYYMNVAATVVVDNVSIAGCAFSIGSTATGWMKVGDPNQDYADENFRARWNVSNVSVQGPGHSVAGSVGISLTQLIQHNFSNLSINAFQQPAIIDRCGNGVWTRTRFQTYAIGPLITNKAGTGSRPAGAQNDSFYSAEFLGPAVDGAYSVTIDAQDIHMYGALYEPQTASPLGFIHITAQGAHFRDFNGVLGASPITNTFVWDDEYVEPLFVGTLATGTLPPISAQNPSATNGSRAVCMACSSEVAAVFAALAPAKAITVGQNNDEGLTIAADTIKLATSLAQPITITSIPGSSTSPVFLSFAGTVTTYVGLNDSTGNGLASGGLPYSFLINSTAGDRAIQLATAGAVRTTLDQHGNNLLTGVTLANIPATAGTFTYCTDCNVASPCTGSGSGAWAFVNAAGTKNCPF